MTLKPVEILLVEDCEDDIQFLEETFAFSRVSNAIHVARDGADAIRYLRKEGKHRKAQTPNLILLDINLPEKNGFEVLREISADPRLRNIPVVVLTGSDREEDEDRSFLEGACAYITKPMDFDKLFHALKFSPFFWSLVTKHPSAPSAEPA